MIVDDEKKDKSSAMQYILPAVLGLIGGAYPGLGRGVNVGMNVFQAMQQRKDDQRERAARAQAAQALAGAAGGLDMESARIESGQQPAQFANTANEWSGEAPRMIDNPDADRVVSERAPNPFAAAVKAAAQAGDYGGARSGYMEALNAMIAGKQQGLTLGDLVRERKRKSSERGEERAWNREKFTAEQRRLIEDAQQRRIDVDERQRETSRHNRELEGLRRETAGKEPPGATVARALEKEVADLEAKIAALQATPGTWLDEGDEGPEAIARLRAEKRERQLQLIKLRGGAGQGQGSDGKPPKTAEEFLAAIGY